MSLAVLPLWALESVPNDKPLLMGEMKTMGIDDDKDRKDDGGRHENEEEKRREGDGQPTRPIDPDIIREPKPGKRGQ